MTVKQVLELRITELREEADTIEAYINELTSKNFEWDRVNSVQLEVMLNLIDLKVSQKRRQREQPYYLPQKD